MYAVIQTGGKQYKVEVGDVINVEKLDVKVGAKVNLDCLLTSDGKDVKVGTPSLGEIVEAKVIEHGKGEKLVIYKYKPKKDYRKKQGHRQPYTQLEILSIGGEKAAPAKKAAPKKEAPKAEAKAEVKEAPKAEAKAEVKVSMSMKKDELIAVAEANGIKVNAKDTKAVIIETIEAAMK